MKSENNLTITGIVASDIRFNRRHTVARFTIAHNFGSGKEPLFLDCVLILRNMAGQPVPQKGNQVRLSAYLRMSNRLLEAVVKTLMIE
jgi:hypothetical protein